ncbi:MAG: hypothetical protein ACKPJJ_08795, partial [Planctomycetaceae bacterium]
MISGRSGEPRPGVRGCAVCCTAGGYGTRAAQVQVFHGGVSPIESGVSPITPITPAPFIRWHTGVFCRLLVSREAA